MADFVSADAEKVLGRPISDQEYRRIIKALEAAFPPFFAEVVLGVAAETEKEQEAKRWHQPSLDDAL